MFTENTMAHEFTSFMKGKNVDICDFFNNPKLNPLLQLVMATLAKYGNKITSCPVKKVIVCARMTAQIPFIF